MRQALHSKFVQRLATNHKLSATVSYLSDGAAVSEHVANGDAPVGPGRPRRACDGAGGGARLVPEAEEGASGGHVLADCVMRGINEEGT